MRGLAGSDYKGDEGDDSVLGSDEEVGNDIVRGGDWSDTCTYDASGDASDLVITCKG